MRIFKQESELEVWKEDKTGRFALLKTYPICRWSGDLGPKIKEGDRQAPEGFYTITPGLMNPNSSYYLAINMGFPNAYDRANGRTGAFLMIHGDCSSRGCYAMTDEQIAEIYALARESFFGGQKSFQIQAYPVPDDADRTWRKHRNSPHMAFWKMLKQGYDHFEVTRLEPKVDVCERRYVFNAESSAKFSASDRCPAYKVPEDIVAAVREKQRRDDVQIAELINRGTPAAPVKMGVDGGMNPTFLAAVKNNGGPGGNDQDGGRHHPGPRQSAGRAEKRDHRKHALWRQPLCRHAEPRLHRIEAGRRAALVNVTTSSVQVASASPSSGGIGGFFSNLFGSKSEEQAAAPSKPEASAPKSKPAAKPAPTAVAAKAKSEPQKSEPQLASAASKPVPMRQEASAAPSKPESINDLLTGAAPTVPPGGFENRFGAWR